MATDCVTALDRLLEADPAELAGEGDTELAAHVRDCPRCRAVGARFLAEQERLAAELSEFRPTTDVERALSVARARRGQARRWRVALEWSPVAAAAAAAAVMLLQSVSGVRMPEPGLAMAPPAMEPLVEMTTEQNVMVFESRDRSAKVIWFY